MSRHLILPDSHCQPGVDNSRYEWLGKFIMDARPDVFINIGDFADMKSLCSYDRGTKGFEGRRYTLDTAACEDALDRLFHPMNKYNKRMAKSKKKGYRPRCIITLGNHEYRIIKAVDQDPVLEGVIDIRDLGLDQYFEVYDFLKPVTVDGVTYCHYMQGKNSANAVGGLHTAYNLLTKYHCSITVGHNHQLDFKTDVSASGNRINALSSGCYFDHVETYAGQSNQSWWRGVVLKDNVHRGDYDWTAIRLETLREWYE